MQRIKNVLFAFGISVIFIANVGAASVCTNAEQAELRTAAGNIRATYEEKERTETRYNDHMEAESDYTYYYLTINITNLSEKFYVEVENDYDKTKKSFNYSDTEDEILSFDWENVYEKPTTFTIKVYSSDKTGCEGELYRTVTVKTPRYNEFSNEAICYQLSDYELCKKWVTYDTIDYEKFNDEVTKYVDKKYDELQKSLGKGTDNSFWERVKEFVSNNKYYFIGGGAVLIVAAGVAVVVIVKRKRSMDL